MIVKAKQDVHVPKKLHATAGQTVAVNEELGQILIARGLVEEVKAVKMVEDIKLEPVTLEQKQTKKKSNK